MKQIHYEVRPGEYADAMRSVRIGRMLLWLICGAAIFTQMAAFLLVEYGGVLGFGAGRRAAPAAAVRPASQPATAPAAAPPAASAPAAVAKKPAPTPAPLAPVAATTTQTSVATAQTHPAAAPTAEPETAQRWKAVLYWLLPAAKFTALIFSFLLVLTVMLTVLLSLVGRLGGAKDLVDAWFWSLLLLSVLIPWQDVLVGSSLAAGAMFNLGEFLRARSRVNPDTFWPDQAVYFGRFLVYPLVAAAIWLLLHVKYGGGCARMDFPQGESAQPAPAARAEPAPAVEIAPDASGEASTDADAGKSALNPLAEKFFRAKGT
jgi:hypothetical protein